MFQMGAQMDSRGLHVSNYRPCEEIAFAQGYALGRAELGFYLLPSLEAYECTRIEEKTLLVSHPAACKYTYISVVQLKPVTGLCNM